jgi:hypothetical protein
LPGFFSIAVVTSSYRGQFLCGFSFNFHVLHQHLIRQPTYAIAEFTDEEREKFMFPPDVNLLFSLLTLRILRHKMSFNFSTLLVCFDKRKFSKFLLKYTTVHMNVQNCTLYKVNVQLCMNVHIFISTTFIYRHCRLSVNYGTRLLCRPQASRLIGKLF